MIKLALLPAVLLLAAGCTTKNYYYTYENGVTRPVPVDEARGEIAPPPPPHEDAAPPAAAKPQGKPGLYPVYGGKAHPRPIEPVPPVTNGDRRVPPADWDPNSGLPQEDAAYAPPPPAHRPAPAIGSQDEGKYVWNKNRTELKEGENYHRPTPPGAAALNGGQLRDPLSFPHFCGPGARLRGAC